MVCTGNKDRSPTAAMVLAEMCAPMWVTSAGTEPWAKTRSTSRWSRRPT
jgi:protein-tyrosine-phosphatase